LVPAALRGDLAAAAYLHDIGYRHPVTGFHPLDGAPFLAGLGFSPVVCNLAGHHSASTYEAEVRGIDSSAYAPYELDVDSNLIHSVLWWADMTTEPSGQTVTVWRNASVRSAPGTARSMW